MEYPLPQPGSTVAASGSVSSPVYMVAAPAGGGQNQMRMVRAVGPAVSQAVSGGQRVVTVTSAALRSAHQAGTAFRAAPPVGTIVRTLQPRQGGAAGGGVAAGQVLRPSTPGGNRPSVIVVQRTPGSPVTGRNPVMVAAAAAGGQKIIHTKVGSLVLVGPTVV